jgi:WD40 repeat protein
MIKISLVLTVVIILILINFILIACQPHSSQAQTASFSPGDVFVSVSKNKIQWHSPNGTLYNVLETRMPNFITTGMAFDYVGNLYVAGLTSHNIAKFSNNGTLLGTFGGNYSGYPESIIFDSEGNVLIGQATNPGSDVNTPVLKFDRNGLHLATYNVAVDELGSDWIELSPDQCILYYTSEGNTIKRYNICTNNQIPDFVDGLPNKAFALRLLPDGGLIVANQDTILRLNAVGQILQTYDAPGEDSWFTLNLDVDDKSFWSAAHRTGNVYKFDIATGNQLLKFNTGPNTSVYGLAINGEKPLSVDNLPPDTFIDAFGIPIRPDVNIYPINNNSALIDSTVRFVFNGTDNVGIAGFECRRFHQYGFLSNDPNPGTIIEDPLPPFSPCTSPREVPYNEEFRNVWVIFEVRAIDKAGIKDPTTVKFRVVTLPEG